jgi:hypothetical protein
MVADPLNLNAQTLYSNEMDRWILNNKVVFERWQLTRGICRIYVIFMAGKEYQIKAATGFVIKLADRKFVISCLSVYLMDYENELGKKLILGGKPLVLASFGNIDLLGEIDHYM